MVEGLDDDDVESGALGLEARQAADLHDASNLTSKPGAERMKTVGAGLRRSSSRDSRR